MAEQEPQPLVAYGWFGVIVGAGMMALAVMNSLSEIEGNGLLAVVTGGGAFLLMVAGWLMLTVAHHESTGRWPQWGMLHVWPTVAAAIAFLAIASIFCATIYFLGGVTERLLLAGIPVDVEARTILSKTGYITGGIWLVLNLPGIGLRLADAARNYTSTLPDDLSPA
jgi:hypothetical protein